VKKITLIILLIFTSVSFAQENIISQININGNKRTKTAFIKKLAFVKVNSVLDFQG